MRTQDIEDLRAYRDKLQAYSTEELEDIYYHVHVLREPLRYNMVRRELDARKLTPQASLPITINQGCLRDWLSARPRIKGHPFLFNFLFSLLLFVISALTTFLLLLPIWMFAMPLHFLGLETAIVYLACAPVPPILAAGFGGKIGGRGLYGVWVLSGVAAGMVLFNATGAPSAIVSSAVMHTSGGGPSFGGF